jgi:hypothetical protein
MDDVIETPDVAYGRLLESAHMTGYAAERTLDGLEDLLEGDRWCNVGPGFDTIDAFLATVDLSPFSLDRERRAALARRLKELGATTRQTAGALGTSHETVARDLRPVTDVTPEPEEPAQDAEHEPEPVTDVTPEPEEPAQDAEADDDLDDEREAAREAHEARVRFTERLASLLTIGPALLRHGPEWVALQWLADRAPRTKITEPSYTADAIREFAKSIEALADAIDRGDLDL